MCFSRLLRVSLNPLSSAFPIHGKICMRGSIVFTKLLMRSVPLNFKATVLNNILSAIPNQMLFV